MYSKVFDFCGNSIILGNQGEQTFIRAFFQEFPGLAGEQALLNNSSFGTAGSNALSIVRFNEFEVKLIFSSTSLLQATIRVPSKYFSSLKWFLKTEWPNVPDFTNWESGLLGMYDVLRVKGIATSNYNPEFVNMESTFTSLFGFNCMVTIKRF